VGRISGKSTDSLSDMTLDVNTDLYPISVGETVQMLLASTLNLDGTKDDEKGWRDTATKSH
jgi:DNA-directed RNA polymerase I, II, and III subunit RPABC3